MSQALIKFFITFLSLLILIVVVQLTVFVQKSPAQTALDRRVEKFLNENRTKWHDWNVPYEDGRVLYNLIIKNNYKRALEIGTSTGHSAIWMAWALSKTGGKLITIEIDEGRYQTALENFKKAGVEEWIDALLILSFQMPTRIGIRNTSRMWTPNWSLAAASQPIMLPTPLEASKIFSIM
jgi:protein-L-isoaspartate O-methyltransferase